MSTKKLQVIDYTVKQAENADTLDGQHASEFASATDMTTAQSNISDLQTKVGDKAVSSQISSAINAIDYPVDSVNGKTGAVTLTAADVGALPADTSIPSISGLATETYVDNKVAGIVDTAPEALDTLNELAAALGDDPNFATTVATQIGTKVDKVDGKGLSTNDYTTTEKTKLAGIETGANKTTIDTALSTTSTNPVQNKIVTAQINNLNTLVGDTAVATQITNAIANKVDKVSGKGLSTNDYTTDEKTKLSGIASGAEVNQNAFSNVVVGTTTIAADSKTDTLTLVAGNNVTITPDATNDKITIAATNTVYTHPSYTARTGAPTANATPAFGGTFNISQPVSDTTGHITAINSRTVTIPSTAATTSAAGLMSATDKSKLDGITSSADSVSFTANATSGNKVGTITINGTDTDMYSPTQTTISGNAGTATKLATARTIQTNLASTSAASFDGSADITPGVSGTLGIDNGGTNATTAEDACANLGAVKKSGDTMTGTLINTSTIDIQKDAYPTLYFSNAAGECRGAVICSAGVADSYGGIILRGWSADGNDSKDLILTYSNGMTVPIANGGTAATTAEDACANLGAVKKSGDTMTGSLKVRTGLHVQKDGYPTLYFTNVSGTNKGAIICSDSTGSANGGLVLRAYNSNASDYYDIWFTYTSGITLPSTAYGTSLPSAGNVGRIFFKKV